MKYFTFISAILLCGFIKMGKHSLFYMDYEFISSVASMILFPIECVYKSDTLHCLHFRFDMASRV